MDDKLILSAVWIGLITYSLLAIIYIYHVVREYKILKFLNIKIIIVLGFILLAYHCLDVIINKNKYFKDTENTKDTKDTENTKDTKDDTKKYMKYLTSFPANIGFILVTLYFCLLFNKYSHFFYIFAPIGYMFLANNNIFGLFPVIIFHFVSIGYHIYDFAKTDYWIFATKIFMSIYYIIFAYIYIQNSNTFLDIFK